jgi:hypothetical protein
MCTIFEQETSLTSRAALIYTRTKSHDHENMRALEKSSKGHTLGNRNPNLQLMGPRVSVK